MTLASERAVERRQAAGSQFASARIRVWAVLLLVTSGYVLAACGEPSDVRRIKLAHGLQFGFSTLTTFSLIITVVSLLARGCRKVITLAFATATDGKEGPRRPTLLANLRVRLSKSLSLSGAPSAVDAARLACLAR